jgi:hypothetical protein
MPTALHSPSPAFVVDTELGAAPKIKRDAPERLQSSNVEVFIKVHVY